MHDEKIHKKQRGGQRSMMNLERNGMERNGLFHGK